MQHYLFALLIAFSSFSFSENEKKDDSNEFKYSSIDIGFIQTDKTAIDAKASLPLPGGLYVVLERKAEGIDTSNDSYDRIINAARIGIHGGIGDIFSSISAKGVKLNVKNIFDLYAEFGVKSTAYDSEINSFSEDDAQANIIAGLRFGNSSGWEGKLFVDISKDSELKIKTCPIGQVCTEAIEYELDDETDQKFGAGAQYNINKRSAVYFEMSSSKIFDSSMKIGYKLKF
tara:strand:- start:1866 stop:2555 length:690 start_codon:yes stop_codon:yes gene_type:complete